ncbi:TPA: ATP-binding protein [Campylobacter fetus subsp. venerealis]|nr:ATP-binding protein [Campylobacter fetus subsp. venerealis]HDX8125956.1 ATP-binding protein [Campylobacter fetus subsp. venerealis]HDX8133698.1 ATP-binding protein [Campylobacter fetus subsp. venerealis]HDX8140887.1 ATP-binding protein [Campylobacter fetus subsp. venerealis]
MSETQESNSKNVAIILSKKIRLSDIAISGFLWLKADDNAYYENLNVIASHTGLEVCPFPTEDEVFEKLQSKNKIVFIAPFHCYDKFKEFIVEISLDNLHGVLTTQEKNIGITKAKALQQKLGISVVDSPYTLSNVGGAEKLKKYVNQLKEAEKNGFKPKGIFLVGIPGTGKTFFPTCLAGELKRPLIMLNLEALKETGEPINRLNQVFEYLNAQDEKFILLIDEIEKMIGNADDPLTGRLMTILSALGDKGSEYKDLQVLIFATANDLASIIENQPAFLRRGRFDELFFVNLPTMENAKEIFNIYVKKFNLEMLRSIYSIDDLMADIEKEYRKHVSSANRFCYTPAEIESFLKRIAFLKMTNNEFTREDVLETIKLMIPIVKSAEAGIDKISAQKELFVEI